MDLLAIHNSPDLIAARRAAIRQQTLASSPTLRQANFDAIEPADLQNLFTLYDDAFFANFLARSVLARTGSPLGFRLSTTMTRASGKTIRTTTRPRFGRRRERFEIAVATNMLFMNFADNARPNAAHSPDNDPLFSGQAARPSTPSARPVTVGGLPCLSRLDALERILEHEMLHLAELLVFNRSSCSAARFKAIALRIFGHIDHRHDLITPREHAATRHDVKVGSRVHFHFAGNQFTGLVNRIHHRATVLVESPGGQRYRNGKKYLKYYIPLHHLRAQD